MAYQVDQNGDLVINGWEKGIAPSPHLGIANMQAVNIVSETHEVMANFARTQQSQSNITATGTLSPLDSSHLTPSIAGGSLVGGVWISVTGSTITGLSNQDYYVTQSANGFTSIQLANYYNASAITGLGATGTASFTLKKNMGKIVDFTIEKFYFGNTIAYRYFVLDSAGLVWVQDTAVSTPGVTWFLPDITVVLTTSPGSRATAITNLNGWLHVFAGNTIWVKATVDLGNTTANTTTWVAFNPGQMMSGVGTPNSHFAFVGHQGKLYYTDTNYIGSIFPNTSLITGGPNIQSYASYTAITTTGTISLLGGSIPTTVTSSLRIPAVFFSLAGNAVPSALTQGTIYYIAYTLVVGATGSFQVFAAASGGAALDIATGATGTQYFSTYYPATAGGAATITFTPQRLNLPFFETAQCMAELGNNVIIGCASNILYPWDQVSPLPGNLIPLPENNVVELLTVSNMVYIFAGSKGNIYLTNGSTANMAISVPDYCAGIAGSAASNEASYVEPYFKWGGVVHLRGRVYFSILDQTAGKAGNCGGIWSFVPTQNMYISQDTGLALRMENQNSYGNYNGYATILFSNQVQTAISPQYFSAWQSDFTTPLYGVDSTSTTPSTVAVIETDLIPTGTLLDKKTFQQIEYKLSAPLLAGESVAMKYRQNSTAAFVTCGTAITESATDISGYFPVPFEKGQWLQLQITLTPLTSVNSSFCRLKEIRIR